MSNIPPPPVPRALREMLKDYPEYLQRLKEDLMRVITTPSIATPLFEVAIWELEGTLDVFMMEANDELEATIASRDAEAIEKAKRKDFAVGAARMNLGGMPELYDYFRTYFPSGYADRGAA